MHIGIVADIHDAFDSFQCGDPSVEVAGLLEEAGAIGVWGNHDFGLSYEVTAEIRASADPTVLRFAGRLNPQLVLAGCRFCHIEPWKDARRLEDLWEYDGVPATADA